MISNLSQKALDLAVTQLGVEENPKGSNDGVQIKEYLKSVGILVPAPWCMSFVYWCFNQSAKSMGIRNPLIKTGGVMRQWKGASILYTAKKPYQAGDVFILNLGKGLGHTGFIESIEGDVAVTIEGNTNDEGSREGYEVARRRRKIASFSGVLRF